MFKTDKNLLSASSVIKALSAIAVIFFLGNAPLLSQPDENILELDPLVHDDPGALIVPAALFVGMDSGFTIIDAGSNAARLKQYSADGTFIEGKLPAYAVEDATTYALSDFNPFGRASWASRDGGILLLEHSGDGQILRKVSDSGGWTKELPEDYVYSLISNPLEDPLFHEGGLADSNGETSLPLKLGGFNKAAVDADGSIYVLSSGSVGKFNRYGIPQWNRVFPADEAGYFLPVSIGVGDDEILIAGVLLPEGLTGDEFLAGYEALFISSPSLPTEDFWRMFEFLETECTPLLLSYSPMNGECNTGIELNGAPIWVTCDGDKIFVLSAAGGRTRVSRIAPDFSEELSLFEIERGRKALEGCSKIAVANGELFNDRVEIEYSPDGKYSEKMSIIRRSLTSPADAELFGEYPLFEGGYLLAGLETASDGAVYVAASRYSYARDGKVAPGGIYLDVYDSSGTKTINFLEEYDASMILNALALAPDGNLILAVADESGILSNPWAMRFSPEGSLIDEFTHLTAAGVNRVNMVGGGTIAVTPGGAIYQCDNIHSPDPDEAYIRKFDADGKHMSDLRKYSMIDSGLVGLADGDPVLYWQERYLLRIKDEEITGQVDLGPHFNGVDVLDVASDDETVYLLTSDGVIYGFPADEGWDEENGLLADIESAVEELREGMTTYINTYGYPPDKLDYEFLYDNISDIDSLLENFYGPGPFDYRRTGRNDFSFMLLGRDQYQSLYEVTKFGAELQF